MNEYESEEDFDDALGALGTTNIGKSKSGGKPSSLPVGRGRKGTIGKNTSSRNVGNRGMKDYMELMDQELAKTNIGKSFVRDGDEVI